MVDAETTELQEELTITLRKPISQGSLTISELRLREPTAGQIESWDKLTGVELDIRAVSIIAGIPEPLVKLIPAREFYKATRFIGSFLA